ncbi:TPA: hypothetical protein ACNG0X_004922, partial [Escherichia coli]
MILRSHTQADKVILCTIITHINGKSAEVRMTNREDWLSAKIAYINGLKSPSEQQRLLVLLAE